MSSWTCPECGCGFPEERGRVSVRAPWRDQDLTWWQRLTMEINDALVMRTYFELHCPNCGNKIISHGGD